MKRDAEGGYEWSEPNIGTTEEEELERLSRQQEGFRKAELSDAIVSFRLQNAEVDEEILVEEVKHSLKEKIFRLMEDDWRFFVSWKDNF